MIFIKLESEIMIFLQNETSLAPHQKSSVAHRLRNTALEDHFSLLQITYKRTQTKIKK